MNPATFTMWMIDVGHGDATVIAFPDGSWGVIDCHAPSVALNPIIRLIDGEDGRSGREARIRFVCVTHPHFDHFSGIPHILDRYKGRIDELWHCGSNLVSDVLAWHCRSAREHGGSCEFTDLGARRLGELYERVRMMRHKGEIRTRALGEFKSLDDMAGVSVRFLAPYEDAMERYAERIASGDAANADHNEVSGVIEFKFGGVRLVLKGDSPTSTSRRLALDPRLGHVPFGLVRASHHGSVNGHSNEFFEEAAKRSGGRRIHVVISADGLKFPNLKVVDELRRTVGLDVSITGGWRRLVPQDPLFQARRESQALRVTVTGGGVVAVDPVQV